MRVSTFFYCMKQGLKNICRNIWFSLASVATISACIFLFCLFFAIVANVRYMVQHMEESIGITVLFDESLEEPQILAIGEEIAAMEGVREMTYISAEEAWASFKEEYFAGMEELAAGFEEDNPLAGSASYEIYMDSLEDQERIVSTLKAMIGVRQVNYSSAAAAGFSSFHKVLGLLSLVVIGVLLAVSVFLINNTISVAAAFRKQESHIMRLIGATNFMIRAPFLVEGVILGLLGAVIPLAAAYVLYTKGTVYLADRFAILSGMGSFLPVEKLYPPMVAVAAFLGVGIGFFGSFFTIRKYMKV